MGAEKGGSGPRQNASDSNKRNQHSLWELVVFQPNSHKRMLLTNDRVTPQVSIEAFGNVKSPSTLHTSSCQNRALGGKIMENF